MRRLADRGAAVGAAPSAARARATEQRARRATPPNRRAPVEIEVGEPRQHGRHGGSDCGGTDEDSGGGRERLRGTQAARFSGLLRSVRFCISKSYCCLQSTSPSRAGAAAADSRACRSALRTSSGLMYCVRARAPASTAGGGELGGGASARRPHLNHERVVLVLVPQPRHVQGYAHPLEAGDVETFEVLAIGGAQHDLLPLRIDAELVHVGRIGDVPDAPDERRLGVLRVERWLRCGGERVTRSRERGAAPCARRAVRSVRSPA